jgi:hypothetical protein
MNSGQCRLKISSEVYRWRATSAGKGMTSWVLMTIESVLYSSYMVGCQQQTSCIMWIDFKLEGNITDPTAHLYTAKISAFKPLCLICRIKVTKYSNGPETLWQADTRSNKSQKLANGGHDFSAQFHVLSPPDLDLLSFTCEGVGSGFFLCGILQVPVSNFGP